MKTQKVKPGFVRPHYIREDGSLDLTRKWQPTPKQHEAEIITAPQIVSVGGIRSGKTAGALMKYITHGLLKYPKSNMLCIRKTFAELKAGPIEDFREHCPDFWGDGSPFYSYHQTDHIVTFSNGSKLVFGHCKSGKETDVQQYLGTAYPWILPDECAQLSPEVWQLLLSRNTVNPECMPDVTQPCGGCGDPQKCGYPCMPSPQMTGCTNPFGPYWDWYYSNFVKKEPYVVPEGARRDKNGRYWIIEPHETRLVYDPDNYGYVHSTVLDNPHALKRDPGLIDRLNMLPPAMRDKMLLGYMEGGTGQYYDVFADENIVDLRDDPEAIVWEPWQPVWGGWDWAIGSHWNACYFFTQALVRVRTVDDRANGVFGTDYRRKTVCFKEYVTQNKLDREMANWISSTLRYPNGEKVKTSAIWFSHEKFARQVEAHSPADQLSNELMAVGICPVSPGTRNRVGRAALMYQMLAHRELVILDTCKDIIKAIPNLMRDEKVIDDVFKPQGANKADDCYDGFSLGLYGFFNQQDTPQEIQEEMRLSQLDPMTRHFQKWGNTIRRQKVADTPRHRPTWTERLKK